MGRALSAHNVDVLTRRHLHAAAMMLAAGLMVGACATTPASTTTEDAGFVAGDGSLLVLPTVERQPAPELQGTTLDGDTFSLADHRGEVVVVNVWASWCAPCRAEAPALAALSKELADSGVQFVGLDTRDSDVAGRAFVERFGITYPSIVDSDGRLQLLFGDSLPPQAIPSTLLIDRDGRVAARALGGISESSLRGLIEPLLLAPR